MAIAATKTMTAEIQSITDKAVFLSIHFNRFGNTRKIASSKVNMDVDKRRIGVTKRLLASDSLQAITRLDYEVLRYIESRCLPFEKGIHALPIGLVEEVDEQLRKFREQRDQLIDAFLTEYPTLLEEARVPLGVLFDQKDYATVNEARDEFGMRWNYLSLATPGVLAEMSEGLFAEERQKIRDKMAESYQEWRDLLRVAMADLVKRLSESTTPGADGKTRKLTDSSVNRLQDFLNTFNLRNVCDDRELQVICNQLKNVMRGITVEQLRESESLKGRIGSAVADAAASLEIMTAGLRRIRTDED